MRTKVTEMWACVGDDGSGPGEGILSVLLSIPPYVAERAPHLTGMPTYVLCVAYDPASAKLMVDQARRTGKTFRVIHFEQPTDVTAEFSR